MVNNVSMNRTKTKTIHLYQAEKEVSYHRFFENIETMFVLILLKFIHQKFIDRIFEMFACYIGQFEIAMKKLKNKIGIVWLIFKNVYLAELLGNMIIQFEIPEKYADGKNIFE